MRKLISMLLLASFITGTTALEGQIFEKIKREAEKKKKQKEDEIAKETVEGIEDILTGTPKDDPNTPEDESTTQAPGDYDPEPTVAEEIQIWTERYDFKAGPNILFYDDFESDPVSEIPSKWHYKQGVMEVVESSGDHGNVMSGDLGYGYPNWEDGYTLPEQYTIEFDVYMKDRTNHQGSYGYTMYLHTDDYRGADARFSVGFGSLELGGKTSARIPGSEKEDFYNKWAHISISVNGNSIKAYYDQYRLINTRLEDGVTPNLFNLWNCCIPAEKPHIFLVDNVKVAEGAHPVYAEELIESKLVTHDILFETGSSDILPRSYPEINRIAEAMKANPGVNFSVEGHTDAVGSDESNMVLSQERAKSVKDALVDMGIEEDRLNTTGYGEVLPIADNETPEGRAMNRRVEFIAQDN